MDASTTDTTESAKSEILTYQADQKVSKQTTSEFNTDTKVTNKDQSGFTYTTSDVSNEKVNNYTQRTTHIKNCFTNSN